MKCNYVFNFRGKMFIGIQTVILVLLLFLVNEADAFSPKTSILFYSSETNINNFISLKAEFDSHLSAFGSYEFQPFSDRKTFEDQIQGTENCILMLSSWHYLKIYKEYNLVPLLVGVRSGKPYQKRIMIVSDRFAGSGLPPLAPVASASNIQHTRSVLSQLFENDSTVNSIRILTVPKDIDALMSVGFGISRSAVVTEHAFNNLKNIDPILHQKLKTLPGGVESLLLLVVAPEAFSKDAKQVVNIIKSMPDKKSGMHIIKMLELDGWKKIEPSDKSKLEE